MMKKMTSALVKLSRRSSSSVQNGALVLKEEKGMGTIFATLAIIVIVIFAAIMLWTWSQTSQTNDQQKIDAKQSQLFN